LDPDHLIPLPHEYFPRDRHGAIGRDGEFSLMGIAVPMLLCDRGTSGEDEEPSEKQPRAFHGAS
jgi:hypothetical protein